MTDEINEELKQVLNELAHYSVIPYLDKNGGLGLEYDDSNDYEPTNEMIDFLISNKPLLIKALANQLEVEDALRKIYELTMSMAGKEVFLTGATVTRVHPSGRFYCERNGTRFNCVAEPIFWNIIQEGQIVDLAGKWGRPFASDNVTIICSNYIVIRGQDEIPF